MTTGTKITLGVVLAIVLGVGAFYGFRDGRDAAQGGNEETATTTVSETPTNGKKMAFSQLAEQKGTYQCSVNQSVGGIDAKGIVYMDKGLLRGEYKTSVAGQNIDVTFIMRDGMTYVWNSMMPKTGFKFKNDTAVQAGGTTVTASTSGGITPSNYLDQIGDYDCQEWTADASKFVIPTTITFQAMN